MKDSFQTLKRPEYVHALLNPLPVYATAMGFLALIAGLVLRSQAAQGAALLIVLVGTLSVWPVAEYGEKGYDRVYSMSNEDGQKWLTNHAGQANSVLWIFSVTATIAAAGIFTLWKFPKAGAWLSMLGLVGSLACLLAGGWISYTGGKVRHTEFRNGPPPEPPRGRESRD